MFKEGKDFWNISEWSHHISDFDDPSSDLNHQLEELANGDSLLPGASAKSFLDFDKYLQRSNTLITEEDILFNYAPLIWMFCRKTFCSKIDKTHHFNSDWSYRWFLQQPFISSISILIHQRHLWFSIHQRHLSDSRGFSWGRRLAIFADHWTTNDLKVARHKSITMYFFFLNQFFLKRWFIFKKW